MTIPYDYARCRGHEKQTPYGLALPAPCCECQRRTSTSDHPMQPWMSPPQFVNGECPERIVDD